MALCMSVRMSQVGVTSKPLNAPSRKQRNDSPVTRFLAPDLGEIRMGSPPTGAPNTGG